MARVLIKLPLILQPTVRTSLLASALLSPRRTVLSLGQVLRTLPAVIGSVLHGGNSRRLLLRMIKLQSVTWLLAEQFKMTLTLLVRRVLQIRLIRTGQICRKLKLHALPKVLHLLFLCLT